VDQRFAHAGIDALRASPQSFLNQRLPDAAIGSGHQNCLVRDCHDTLLIRRGTQVPTLGLSEPSMMQTPLRRESGRAPTAQFATRSVSYWRTTTRAKKMRRGWSGG